MGWKLKDRPKTLKVTREMARRWANMEPAPGDRPLSERRLMVYNRLMRNGGFRPCTWADALCLETNGTYRVNGKHTSTMLSSLEDPFPEYYIVLEEYICDKLSDVADLYSTFDSKMQSRSVHDINTSFASTIPELANISHRIINSAVAGMGFHLGGGLHFDSRQEQPADRAERLLEYPEFVLWLQDMKVNSNRHLIRKSVIGAIFATWLRAPTRAEVFWSAVRDETGTSPELPDRKLAKYLVTTAVSIESGGKRQGTDREVYAKALHAWNAWRKGVPTDLKFYPEKDLPKAK